MYQNRNRIIRILALISVIIVMPILFFGCNDRARDARIAYKEAKRLMQEEEWKDASWNLFKVKTYVMKYKDTDVLQKQCLAQYVIGSINRELEYYDFPVLTDLIVEKYLENGHQHNSYETDDKIDLYSEQFEDLTNEAKLFISPFLFGTQYNQNRKWRILCI